MVEGASCRRPAEALKLPASGARGVQLALSNPASGKCAGVMVVRSWVSWVYDVRGDAAAAGGDADGRAAAAQGSEG